tara:strand:+ start:60 stop:551 length:492 start_codon:yes stop_codon:yes gene_type:complete
MRKIGIDTGKHGGIVALNSKNEIIGKWVMPLDESGEIDLHALDVIFKGLRPTVYGYAIVTIEDPGKHAQSSQAIGGMRYGFGVVKQACVSNGISFHTTSSRVWQSYYWTHRGDKTTKQKALEEAKDMWPEESFLHPGKPRSKKAHDGLVDAALIALFGLTWIH